MKQLLTYLTNYWNSIKHNQGFVAFRGLFLGAFISQLQSAYSAGHLTFTGTAFVHMAYVAVFTSIISVWHLSMPAPTQTETTTSSSISTTSITNTPKSK